ncbi:diacylglycerol kinase family protein [Prosthecobacter sp.]|jgi:diacylglycerol kinase|uniref:diacylglycerol kinase family protein n=1 Tax=Prosthecobacter sp. TaxID=1965333 RepID=UPI003783D1E2
MFRCLYAVLRSFAPAFEGLCWALRTQRNLRVHAAAVVIVTSAGVWLGLQAWEWCAVLLAAGLVLTAELLNTAVEALADRVSREREEAIRRVKDVAAAAVLIAALISVVVGFIVFLPKLWRLFENVPSTP